MSINKSVINALYELTSVELEQFLLKCPGSIKYLISSAELKYCQYNKADFDVYINIIRLTLVVAIHIGGATIYMPYPKDRDIMKLFVNQLVTWVLQDASVSLDEIEGIISSRVTLHKNKWPIYMQMMLKVVQNELKDIDLDEKKKIDLACCFIDSFLLCFSGRARSFPSGISALSILRSKAVCKEFKGNNVNELSRRFGVSSSVVYGYIRQDRANRRNLGFNIKLE